MASNVGKRATIKCLGSRKGAERDKYKREVCVSWCIVLLAGSREIFEIVSNNQFVR